MYLCLIEKRNLNKTSSFPHFMKILNSGCGFKNNSELTSISCYYSLRFKQSLRNIENLNFNLTSFLMKRQRFTEFEDAHLIQLVEQHGQDWKLVSSFMENRNQRQVKERYVNFLSPDVSKEKWSDEEDQLLRKKVQEVGKNGNF
jgi:hypothetical protein